MQRNIIRGHRFNARIRSLFNKILWILKLIYRQDK
jgi:hypothetical protein